ncbi:MAG: helix-turn-helix domain-containing protein [Herbinix sp.]|nr:helix-turn-helix domain-containing protein [Herbinix sp.]
MDNIKTGSLILKNRKEKKMTQKELADKLNVSDKTISKWERGQGCPDIASINDLAEVLGVNVTEILSGETLINDNSNGNLKRMKFYACPKCGNIITSTNDLIINCCGRKLEKLEANKEPDKEHMPTIELIEGDLYVCMDHVMDKKHYISFIAFVSEDKLLFNKLYPEQNAEVRFHRARHGILYMYCNQHGLWMKRF